MVDLEVIIAVATAATAVLAAPLAAAAILDQISKHRDRSPAVDFEPEWVSGAPRISIRIMARNRSADAMRLTGAALLEPDGTLEPLGMQPVDFRANKRLPLSVDMEPAGSVGHHRPPSGSRAYLPTPIDVASEYFMLQPPAGWRGGTIRIAFDVEMRSATIRRTRVTTTRSIAAWSDTTKT